MAEEEPESSLALDLRPVGLRPTSRVADLRAGANYDDGGCC